MISFLLVCFISMMTSSILYLLCFNMSYKLKNKNKMSAFECGFSGYGGVNNSFSLTYFIILIMFLIFDLELSLLIGSLMSISILNFLILMFFIIGGIYLEWYLGKLKWLV